MGNWTRKFFVLIFAVLSVCRSYGAEREIRSIAGLVAADSEEASRVGMEILKRGGNAVDAAVATSLALSVVDQASSGLGGGGFMVLYRARDQRAFALDFRETAPKASRRELYLQDGKPAPELSLSGGLAVAVPGQTAGLSEAHRRFGTLPWATLLAPAVRLAGDGFAIDATLRVAIERQRENMRRFKEIGRIYMPGGAAPKEGEIIRQPELAGTLKAIAQGGARVFYEGRIGRAIVETVQKEGGVMTLEDIKNYRPLWREPLVGTFRGWTAIGMPPPSSGGVAILTMLNVLEGYRLEGLGHNSAAYLHLLTEAMKHAFADRAAFLGDPDFVHVPVGKLTAKPYAAWIRGRIKPDRTQKPQYYGYSHFHAERGGTTHLSVIDAQGNAVALTQTVNTRFGSKLLDRQTGIVLNNQMDDFAIHQDVGNVYGLVGNQANSLQPGKRPLSSMSPTIVVRRGRAELVVGAAGGPRIINATLQTILNVLEFRMPVRDAVGAPRIHHQWLPDRLIVEANIGAGERQGLEERGHMTRELGGLGVVQAVERRSGQVSGAGDPRKFERARTE